MTDTEEAGAVARALAMEIWGNRDPRAAWRLLDQTFRLCLAQQWVWDNVEAMEADGRRREVVADTLAVVEPVGSLWEIFAQVHQQAFDLWPNLAMWGITTAQRLIEPGVELILYVNPGITEIPEGALFEAYPCIVRHGADGWRVLNLYSETFVPRPGWPPTLRDPVLRP